MKRTVQKKKRRKQKLKIKIRNEEETFHFIELWDNKVSHFVEQ